MIQIFFFHYLYFGLEIVLFDIQKRLHAQWKFGVHVGSLICQSKLLLVQLQTASKLRLYSVYSQAYVTIRSITAFDPAMLLLHISSFSVRLDSTSQD